MRVRYSGPSVGVDLLGPDDVPVRVERNHTLDVPDAYGKRLIQQESWAAVKESPDKPDDKKGNES